MSRRLPLAGQEEIAESLRGHRDFVRFWAAATISVFGGLITRTALPFAAILVLRATPLQVGLLSAAELAPQFLFGLAAGVWADRRPRRPVLIVANLGRAALLVTIPITAMLGWLRIEQLYAVAFLAGLLTVFFDVADQSYLPTLVRHDRLLEANSKLAATSSVAEIGSFGIGGWLVQWLTAPVALLVDAAGLIGSAFLIGSIRSPEPAREARDGRHTAWREIVEGLETVLRHPLLRAIAGCTLTSYLAFRIFGAILLLYATRELGVQPGTLGMVFAVGGASSLAGAVVAHRWGTLLGTGRMMIAGVLTMGVCMFLVPLARDASLLALGLLVAQQLGDGGFTMYSVSEVSLRQAVTPRQVLGRANASVRFATIGAMLLGSVAGGVLGQTIGLRATLTLAAAGVALASLWLVASPIRALRTPAAGIDAVGSQAYGG